MILLILKFTSSALPSPPILHDDRSAELHCFKSDIIIIKLPERNNRTFFKNRKLNISNVERFSRFNQESPAMLSIYLIAIVRMIMTRQIYDKNDFSKSMISHKSKKFKSLWNSWKSVIKRILPCPNLQSEPLNIAKRSRARLGWFDIKSLKKLKTKRKLVSPPKGFSH